MTRSRRTQKDAPATRVGRMMSEERGIALITVVWVVFVIGMMLFAFAFSNQGELGFAQANRNSLEALNLAEAGAQEALKRMSISGYTPGVTPASFTNSLALLTPGASGTVYYQPHLTGNAGLTPVLSVATYGGMTRKVRILVNTASSPWEYQIFGNGINFDGNTTPTTGNDLYSTSGVEFENYPLSPLCAATATATNLVSPQVLAGTMIYGESPGASVVPPCGAPNNAGTYFAECNDLQTYYLPIQTGGTPSGAIPTSWQGFSALGEVAPTTCAGDGNRAVSNTGGGMSPQAMGASYSEPVNWHALTPVAMSSTDFTTVINKWNGNDLNLPPGMHVVQASQTPTNKQSQVQITYTPVAYTPTYWTVVPSTNTKVMIVATPQPFCVNSSLNTVVAASLVSPYCAAGSTYYGYNGNLNGSSDGSSDDQGVFPARFLDWGLVSDDINRGTPTTFFGTGFQNGIRYIPLYSPINISAWACNQTMNPGTNVFDNVNGLGTTCANPPTTTINSTSVTFSGTKASPEALVISNNPGGGQAVTVTGSVAGQSTGTSCVGINPGFDAGNWGVILASGDLTISGNLVFTGFIYAQGNIRLSGASQHIWLQGGIQALQPSAPADSGWLNFSNASSFVGLCGGIPPSLGSPMFSSYAQNSWTDVPGNKP
jgi:hypothetical protein